VRALRLIRGVVCARGAVAVLNLSGCSGISDAGGANLMQLLSNHPTLRSISLSAVRSIGDLTLKQVARSMDHAYHVIAMRWSYDDHVIAMRLQAARSMDHAYHAIAMRLLYDCHAIAMRLPCGCHAVAMRLQVARSMDHGLAKIQLRCATSAAVDDVMT
jgi:hypothetical protein